MTERNHESPLERLIQAAEEQAAIALIAEPASHEQKRLTESFADGRVRRYADSTHGSLSSVRTEIDLPEGFMLTVHKNVKPVAGLAAARFDSIVVTREEEELGTIELTIDKRTSQFNPTYIATVQGHEVRGGCYGQDMDLALADDFLGRAVSLETGSEYSYGHYGYVGYVSYAITELMRGRTPDEFEPGIFVETVEPPQA